VLAELRRAAVEKRQALPGIRQMASGAGVAHVTMWKAVRDLAAEGGLRTVAHRQILPAAPGDRAPGAGPLEPGPAARLAQVPGPGPAVPHWQQIHERLEHDIVAGLLPAGRQLPSAKELRASHGASHATVRRAFAALASQGRIERHGRGYRVPALHAGARLTTVVFIGKSRCMDMLTDLSPRAQELWRALESRCARMGLRLVVQPVEQYLADTPRVAAAETGVVAGYVVRNLDLPPPEAARLLAALCARQRPVAVVDELGAGELLVRAADRPGLRVFAVAHSEHAGRLVADHLRGLGHRSVAFLSPYHEAAWSRTRLEGIRRVFAEARLPDAVTAHVPGTFPDDFALRDHARALAPFRLLLSAVQQFDRSLGAARSTVDTYTRDPAFGYVLRRALAAHMRQSFEEALAGRATAWVGVDDATALAAMRFLADMGHRVPAEISVAGFDDTFEAAAADLTSVDFNVPALADALLGHVLGRPLPRAARPRPVEIAASVVRWGSTAAERRME